MRAKTVRNGHRLLVSEVTNHMLQKGRIASPDWLSC